MRIGFLFNHDQLHQVAHSLPIALRLADMGTGAEILLATTSDRIRAEVELLGGNAIGRTLKLVPLELRSRTARLVERLAGRWIPARKLFILGDNLDFFATLDLLVVAEKTSLALKRRFGLDRLKIVHTRHGAGDRAIGFDKASAEFDAVLVSGRKVGERLVAEAGIAPERLHMVGYPKFDLHRDTQAALPWPADDRRPIILYNPHPSPHLSSWYAMGPAILDWFVAHPEYRLLFAPHVMLFERPLTISIDRLRLARPGRIEPRWNAAENIFIDTGSRASTTMAYTNSADVYLGDASSQVYEYLVRPRPCLFVDAQHSEWQDNPNFTHWRAGPVIDDVARIGEGLARARADFDRLYRPIQEQLVAHSFDLTDEPSALRAARAIARIAGLAQ